MGDGGLEPELVDERDSAWELTRPRFRIYIQDPAGPGSSHATATYDVTDVDVLTAIDWARQAAGESSTFAVALVHDDVCLEAAQPGKGRGIVWLLGRDMNAEPL